MKTQFVKHTQTHSGHWLVVIALLLACLGARAQTLVSGNISGTWTPAGNPYIAVDNCTVPPGQTLTIQPGVVVWIGSNVTINATGLIQAVGTPSQRITFQSPTTSQHWNSIYCLHLSGTNRFKYCDFRNADTALRMQNYGGNDTMSFEIMNCSFSNCVSQALLGQANGIAGIGYANYAIINSVVKNCYFSSGGAGCRFYIDGVNANPWGIGYGYGSLQIAGNVFHNMTNAAISMAVGSYADASAATVINNTLVNCRTGIDSQDPWDAKVQSCIFIGCSNAVQRSGSLSGIVGYNDFYLNATNFTGYPGTYGAPIIVNRNGTSSDLLFNIFQDPLFVGASDYHLTASSTCIDAGVGDPANFDSCFPPSLGSVTNDIGAYGGPNGCEWIAPPSTNIFTVALARYYGITINPPTNGHYRLEYAPALGNTNNWTQLTNFTLNAPFTYFDPVAFGPRFYRAVLLP